MGFFKSKHTLVSQRTSCLFCAPPCPPCLRRIADHQFPFTLVIETFMLAPALAPCGYVLCDGSLSPQPWEPPITWRGKAASEPPGTEANFSHGAWDAETILGSSMGSSVEGTTLCSFLCRCHLFVFLKIIVIRESAVSPEGMLGSWQCRSQALPM